MKSWKEFNTSFKKAFIVVGEKDFYCVGGGENEIIHQRVNEMGCTNNFPPPSIYQFDLMGFARGPEKKNTEEATLAGSCTQLDWQRVSLVHIFIDLRLAVNVDDK